MSLGVRTRNKTNNSKKKNAGKSKSITRNTVSWNVFTGFVDNKNINCGSTKLKTTQS